MKSGTASPLTAGQRGTLVVTGAAFFMVLLDITIVSVALPTVQDDLGASLTGLGWVISGYTLPFAVLLLGFGTLGDRIGRRTVLLVGVAIFTLGSLLCTVAPSLPLLIAGRAVQGIGGAAVAPTSLALIAVAFPEPRRRVRVIGVWSSLTGVALAIGPLISGVLISLGGEWRLIFAVNVPLGFVAVAMGLRVLPRNEVKRAQPLDVAGQVLAVLALAPFVYAVSQAESRGWASTLVMASLAISALMSVAFLARQGTASSPMLPLGLFRDRTLSSAALVTVAVGWVLTSHSFFVSQYFQVVAGNTPLGSGLRTLPTTASIFLLAPFAGRLAASRGARAPVVAGAVSAGIGLLGFVDINDATAYALLAGPLVLVGAGFGLMMGPLVATAIDRVPSESAGLGSSLNNVARQVGGTVGVAVLATLVASRQSTGGRSLGDGTALHAVFWVNAALMLSAAALAWIGIRSAHPPRAQPPPTTASPRSTASNFTPAPATHPGETR